jgi:hypothetical protein
MSDRKDYKTIPGVNGRALNIALLISLIFAILGHTLGHNWILDAILFFSPLLIIYTWCPRKCPRCDKKMERDVSKGLLPEGYFCKKDKVYCPTYVQNEV